MQDLAIAKNDDTTRASDYRHGFHAGNVGDVWKHVALVGALQAARSTGCRVRYLDTHAGDGRYPLPPAGEWGEGIGRLWTLAGSASPVVDAYVGLVRDFGLGEDRLVRYPGSPVLAARMLGDDDALALWERDDAVLGVLRATLGRDPRVAIVDGDGLAALAAHARGAEAGDAEVLVLVDPPFTAKSDWTVVPDALVEAVRATTTARFLLWYPIKSLTRPNAMHARLAAAGIAATIAEVVTTPLEHQRNRLNGSGVVLVRPAGASVEALAQAAPVVGAACATRNGEWSMRVRSWG